MELEVKLKMEALVGAATFGQRPGLILSPKAIALFATINGCLLTLRKWGVTQISGLQDLEEGIANRRAVAADIRARLGDIADIAKSMEEEGLVGTSDLFRRPRYQGYEALMHVAQSFADRAEPMVAEFTDRGLPATFVADLRAAIAAFRGATERKYGGKASRTAGTAGLLSAANQGMKALRVLRPIMRVHLKSQPALLEAWKLASRVARMPRKSDARKSEELRNEDSVSIPKGAVAAAAPSRQDAPTPREHGAAQLEHFPIPERAKAAETRGAGGGHWIHGCTAPPRFARAARDSEVPPPF